MRFVPLDIMVGVKMRFLHLRDIDSNNISIHLFVKLLDNMFIIC